MFSAIVVVNNNTYTSVRKCNITEQDLPSCFWCVVWLSKEKKCIWYRTVWPGPSAAADALVPSQVGTESFIPERSDCNNRLV